MLERGAKSEVTINLPTPVIDGESLAPRRSGLLLLAEEWDRAIKTERCVGRAAQTVGSAAWRVNEKFDRFGRDE